MKKIQLPHNKFTLVDDSDYEWLNQWKWHVQPSINTEYVVRTEWLTNKKCICIRMHRLIMDASIKELIDHKDGNGLNNQRNNLRKADSTKNGANRRTAKNSSSKYLGVHFCNTRKKWVSQIQHKGKGKHLGVFNDEVKAAESYNMAAIELHGEFANLNQI